MDSAPRIGRYEQGCAYLSYFTHRFLYHLCALRRPPRAAVPAAGGAALASPSALAEDVAATRPRSHAASHPNATPAVGSRVDAALALTHGGGGYSFTGTTYRLSPTRAALGSALAHQIAGPREVCASTRGTGDRATNLTAPTCTASQTGWNAASTNADCDAYPSLPFIRQWKKTQCLTPNMWRISWEATLQARFNSTCW